MLKRTSAGVLPLICCVASLIVAAALRICEEKGCPTLKARLVNIHLIPHSHNDAGWIIRLEDMYKGDVQGIYDGTIEALLKNKVRRYVSAENVYFSRWWSGQNETLRNNVRALVSSGRLQFVGGGWVQNDEAVTHYTAIIDQMTLGLRFLNDTFGECGRPTVAWQADPFGHSRNQANLFALMGFDGLMIARISMDTFDERASRRQLIFVWRTEPGSARDADILTWIPPNTYNTPLYHVYTLCPGELGFEKKDIFFHEPSRMALYSLNLTSVYPAKHLGILYGGDLAFRSAEENYEYMDAVIQGVNKLGTKNYTVHASYSTPSCYLNALHASNRTWSVFDEDFFPYTDMANRTWAGFFTSRPVLKYLARYSNGFLQACKQLSAAAGGRSSAQVRVLQEAVATAQHHDAITGTSTDLVALDYIARLTKGIDQCEVAMKASLSFLLSSSKTNPNPIPFTFCHNLNISQCRFTEKNREFIVLVYNPMSRAENVTLRFPISSKNVSITDVDGGNVEAQVVEVLQHSTPIPDRTTNVKWELATVVPVPALGFSTFHVTVNSPQRNSRYILRSRKARLSRAFRRIVAASASVRQPLHLKKQEEYIENSRYRLVVNTSTGTISKIHLVKVQKVLLFRQTFRIYKAQDEAGVQSPGHYVFSAAHPSDNLSGDVKYKIVKGPLVEEIHQVHNGSVSQVIRLYKDADTIEFQWTVGPIPIDWSFTGADVITRYETDLRSANTFYTDGNGRQNMKRTRRVSRIALQVPSNYYPVVSWIYIQDKKHGLQLSVIPDRPQGGSSNRDGALELMVHRRHASIDHLGNPEYLTEADDKNQGVIVTGRHRVFFGTLEESVYVVRLESLRSVYMPVPVFVAPSKLLRHQRVKRSILRGSFPNALHVLTLEPIKSKVLLRLEHLGAVEGTVSLSINTLLKDFELVDIQPTLLAANQYLKNATRRLKWKVAGQRGENHATESRFLLGRSSDYKVTLAPGEIQTFVANLQSRH
ncbi:lysosomal alpha-mannosidase-like isoform X2 [Ornithodoros turicata]